MSKRRGRPVKLAISNASTEVLSPNEKRVGIFLGADTVADVWFTFGEAAVLNTGIFIPKATQSLYIDESMIGEQIKGTLFAITSGIGATCGVWEVFEP